jgi:hypothetical protein
MRIDASGNVGIGTSAPSVKLDIATADNTSIRALASTNGVDCRLVSIGLSGNAGIVGTYSNHALVFNTNATEQARITNTGNVGIGTSTPVARLDVAGTIQAYDPVASTQLSCVTNTGQAALILRRNGAATDRKIWEIVHGDSGSNGYFVIRAVNDAYNTSDDGITITRPGSGFGISNIILGTNRSERLRVDSSGNVGIGTSAPADLLTVYGTSAPAMRVQDASGYTQIYTTGGSGVIRNVGSGSLLFSNNGAERMRIDASGNVGIGVVSFGTAAEKVLGFANAVAPTSSPAGMGQLYVENGALKYRGSSGTVTTIANA